MKIRKNYLFHAAYWVLVCPIVTVLLLEITLQLLAWAQPLFSDRITKDGWMSADRLCVLAVGDSNTYGTYLKLEESYPKQVEKLWNETHDKKMEVINAGYPGTSSSGVIKNLPSLLDTFDPDITLLMIGTNDFWTEPEPELASLLQEGRWFDGIKKHSRVWKLYLLASKHEFKQEELFSLERPVVDSAALKSLQQVDKKKLEVINEGLRDGVAVNQNRRIKYQGKDFDFSNKLAVNNKSDPGMDPRKILENNFIAIAKFAEQNDRNILFVSYAGNKFFYKAANRALARAHETYAFPYVNVTTAFQQLCPDRHICPEYLFFDQHATAAGNRVVAEKVVNYLEEFIRHE